MGKALKLIGITFSLSFLSFLSLAIFIKALGILFEDWFAENVLMITIFSGVLVLIFILTGAISLGKLSKKGRGFLP